MEAPTLVADYVTAQPDARLCPLVDGYIGYRESAVAPLLRREFAGSRTVLILGWGAPVTVNDPRGGAACTGASLIAGPHDSFVVTESCGVAEAVQLMLSPWGARVVFGMPLGELANRTVAVDALPERWLDTLRVRLAEASSWPRRFAILDEALLSRRDRARAPDAHLEWAWQRLTASRGCLRIAELADELDVSRGRLARQFRHELGLAPKTMARLLRFDAAYANRARAASEGWGSIAAECGYFDQAHLNADFRQFTGSTPVEVARHPMMNIDALRRQRAQRHARRSHFSKSVHWARHIVAVKHRERS